MQENNFEKKVQQRMEELNISPSGAVWDKVYARIKKEKRRRRFIIWFLLGGALVAGGGALWFSGKKDKTVITDHTIVKTTAAEKETKSEKTIMPDEINNLAKETAGEQEQPENETRPVIKKETIIEKKPIPLKEFRLPEKLKKDYTPDKRNQVLKSNKTEPAPVSPSENLKTGQQNNLGNTNAEKISPPAFTEPVTADNKNADKQTPQQTPAIDSLKQKSVQQPPADKTDSVMRKAEDPKKETDSLKQKSEKPKDPAIAAKTHSKKWKWGIHFSPGISSMNEQLLSISSNKSAELFTNPNSSVGGPVVFPASPSESKPGFAIQLGGFVQKQLKPRSHFSFGLQYGYYSDRIGVGNRRDSLLNSSSQFDLLRNASVIYSPGDDSSHYTNRYHFIEMPVQFKWQLNKNNKRPLYLHVGVSVSRLITVNALVYDTAFGGIYYNNKSRFNKTRFSLSTGLTWVFFRNGRVEWSIGPVAEIHLNRMLNNPLDRNKYLFFAGIRTSILFNKKK